MIKRYAVIHVSFDYHRSETYLGIFTDLKGFNMGLNKHTPKLSTDQSRPLNKEKEASDYLEVRGLENNHGTHFMIDELNDFILKLFITCCNFSRSIIFK